MNIGWTYYLAGTQTHTQSHIHQQILQALSFAKVSPLPHIPWLFLTRKRIYDSADKNSWSYSRGCARKQHTKTRHVCWHACTRVYTNTLQTSHNGRDPFYQLPESVLPSNFHHLLFPLHLFFLNWVSISAHKSFSAARLAITSISSTLARRPCSRVDERGVRQDREILRSAGQTWSTNWPGDIVWTTRGDNLQP